MGHHSAARRRFLFLCAVIAPSAWAGVPSVNWTGAGTPANPTSWGNGANWAGGVVPASGLQVTFGTGFASGLNITIAGANPVSLLTVSTSQSFNLMPDPGSAAKVIDLQSGSLIRTATSSGTQTISAPVQQDVQNPWNVDGTGALVVSGPISGAKINKAGAGTLVLSGSNSFAGLSVTAGTLVASLDQQLGAAGATLSIGKATIHADTDLPIDRPLQLLDTATFDVSSSSPRIFLEGGVSGTGAIIKTGTGRMRLLTPIAGPLNGGSNTYVGDVSVLQGQLITNPSALRGNLVNFGEVQFSQGGGGSYTSNISGTGTLTLGGGSILLSGSNSISGGITINDTNVGITSDINLGASSATVTLNNSATVLRLISPITTSRPFVLTAGVSPTIETVTGTSTFGQAPTGSGSLLKTGSGAFTTPVFQIGTLNVSAGAIGVNSGGSNTSKVSGLAFGGSVAAPVGSLDLGATSMAIDYPTAGPTPLDMIRQFIKAGYNAGSWNGNGLTSSSAKSSSASHKTALGYAEAPAVNLDTSFNGVPTDATTIIVRYTYAGDVNLDKTVNTSDFSRMSLHFNETGTWFNGDMNYDGRINALDFNILAQNFGQMLPAPAMGSLVPEPISLVSLTFLAAVMRRSKRRIPNRI